MNQPSPPQARARTRARSRTRRAPPTALGVVEAGERVEERVEVGRDAKAEHLEVVADVADHRELVRASDVVEAPASFAPPTPPERATFTD